MLDFESNDAALDEALGGGTGARAAPSTSRRAPGGELPAKLSPAQINESVARPHRRAPHAASPSRRRREPDATGVLKMRWVIAGDGGARDVKTLTPEYANGQFAPVHRRRDQGDHVPALAARPDRK